MLKHGSVKAKSPVTADLTKRNTCSPIIYSENLYAIAPGVGSCEIPEEWSHDVLDTTN